ncbi:MAG: ABC transporter permease [Anaerolineaceae bacterium]|jgi:ABC-type dipeptide/oligopeptide/nickel transport system permease component|nr:ABC transporter permease [Anaerolineaceae bacterium]
MSLSEFEIYQNPIGKLHIPGKLLEYNNPMLSYILKRLFEGILTFFGVSILVFVMGRMTGDPVRLLVPETAPQETREAVRQQLGLDKPLYEQYFGFVGDLVQGDLGQSYYQKADVADLVFERMPATLKLAFVSILISVIVAIPLGIFAALYRNGIGDLLCSTFALIGQAAPNFWVALILMLIFSVKLRWLPISGTGSYKHIILPAFTLSLSSIGYFTRIVRSSMLEVLGQDYIRTARSKGLKERTVIGIHGLKNALIPVVTVMGMSFGTVLSGAFVIEMVFAWPGIGRLGVNALFQRDFPVIQGVIIVSSTIFVLVNLFVDVIYTVLDPRIRVD